VAAELEKEPNVNVETIKGGLGELSVDVEGKKVYSGNRLWYPTPSSVIKKVRSALSNSEKGK
jgi:hypothetical protein